jgi:N-carbamoylputrescine amidase
VLNLYERDGAEAYDTSPVIEGGSGNLRGRTRMLHITDYEGFHEQGYYAPGNAADGTHAAPVYDLPCGRVGVAICYDRHFPEVLRAYAQQSADLVVVPQAGVEGEWPDDLFEAELRVGAFQNGFFMALANRIGAEERLTFDGGSFVADPFGQLREQAPRGEEAILYADLDLARCREAPARKLFLKHRRPALYDGGAVRARANDSAEAQRGET